MEAILSKDFLRQFSNLISVILAITVNVLASTLPLNGQNTGQISDRFQVFFVPAGYVFSIWSLIFIWWIVFAIFQFLPAQKENPRLRNLGYWFALSSVFNAAWLFCWHFNLFGLSVLVMLALLGTLIMSYVKLDVGRSVVSDGEKWAVDVSFSVYLGWISVATVANITSWLYSINWNGFGIAPQVWAVIMLIVASLIGVMIALSRKDSGYLFVFVWAFAGIAVKQAAEPLVAITAWVAIVTMLGFAIYSIFQRRRA